MKSGIYQILNKVNGKSYVGQTDDFEIRERNHRNSLRANKHFNKHLQSSWNIYGLLELQKKKDIT